MTRLVDLTDPTPAALAYLNLSLAGLIPLTWLIVRYLHGLRPRWLSSIRPRLRWPYLFVCFGLAFVALFATILVAAVLPSAGAGAEMAGEVNDFTPEIRDFLLVVLLLTPLQAAAEEYAFRGYLLQAFGGFVATRRSPSALSSLLFALAHGIGQDIPIFFDRFAFGARRRHPRDRHRRPRGRHRDARAQQLARLRRRARVRRHGLGAQPDRRHLVEHPRDAHPVAGLPRRWRGGWPGGWASNGAADPAVLAAPEARV